MLKLESVCVAYGDLKVLHEVSLEIKKGELVALIGSNGAGKTTLVDTISGLNKVQSGLVEFDGQVMNNLPAFKRVEAGIIQVPEGRRLFGEMTVLENIELGAYPPFKHHKWRDRLDSIIELFPLLKDKCAQLAKTLSGGEQQVCAIARALIASPKLLMLDEPSLGLAPVLYRHILGHISYINKQGMTMLLVEQNVREALAVADTAYVLERGRVILRGQEKDLLESDVVRKAYLGI
jgi:branched-chain amino acid transport system ATP-binding protein